MVYNEKIGKELGYLRPAGNDANDARNAAVANAVSDALSVLENLTVIDLRNASNGDDWSKMPEEAFVNLNHSTLTTLHLPAVSDQVLLNLIANPVCKIYKRFLFAPKQQVNEIINSIAAAFKQLDHSKFINAKHF